MSYGLIATLIVLAIVIGAITTKKCEAFLIAGSMVGAIVLWKQDFLTKWVSTLEGVISDEAYVILICGLFGSLVALLTASKGSFGFAVLVGIAVATGDLVVAAIIAILVSMVLYIAGKIMTFSEFWDTFVKGFSDMLPIIILLISALTFQKIASEMQMTEFFVDLCKPFMAGSVFPMITFIIVGLLAFIIVTIARQFGSLGRPIAMRMSEKLGVEFYDRDIVEEAAKKLNLPVSKIDEIEESAKKKVHSNNFRRMMYPLGTQADDLQDKLFEAQENIIKFLAERESCIIVGRCSDFILADETNLLRIYIYAPYEERVKNCVNDLKMDETDARKMIRAVDEARDHYHMHYTGFLPNDQRFKEIMIDSSMLETEGTADYLVDAVKMKFGLE